MDRRGLSVGTTYHTEYSILLLCRHCLAGGSTAFATARSLRLESTGERIWVTPDQVQIFVADTTSPEPNWWFIPNNATTLQVVNGFIHWPLDQKPLRMTNFIGGDVSPWYWHSERYRSNGEFPPIF